MGSTEIFYTIIVFILLSFLFERVLSQLNDLYRNRSIPRELEGLYDNEKYLESQRYGKTNSKFSSITSSFSLVLTLLMFFFDGFAWIDEIARSYTQNPAFIAMIFFGILGLGSDLLSLPFSLYGTFVIEEKFGFNRTTPKTYFLDKLKGYALAAIVGGGLLYAIVWVFENTGENFWLLVWGILSGFMLLATMFYASWVLPLFNKLTPLENGELRTAIESYCDKVNFKLSNLYIMDGSKRSNKANAFFSGLGAKKKIVLYDTLVEKHSIPELVSILAHEIGHYKKKHTMSSVVLSVLQTGIMLYLLSLFISKPQIALALGVEQPSFHIGALAFSILYSPISTLTGIGMNILSRKNEYEADNYAAETASGSELVSALKRMSVEHLSNLTPPSCECFCSLLTPAFVGKG